MHLVINYRTGDIPRENIFSDDTFVTLYLICLFVLPSFSVQLKSYWMTSDIPGENLLLDDTFCKFVFLRIPDQNWISWLYNLLKIYHSGQAPLIWIHYLFFHLHVMMNSWIPSDIPVESVLLDVYFVYLYWLHHPISLHLCNGRENMFLIMLYLDNCASSYACWMKRSCMLCYSDFVLAFQWCVCVWVMWT